MKKFLKMRSFKGVPGIIYLHLHLFSNFKVSSLLTLVFFTLICHYSPKVLKKPSFFLNFTCSAKEAVILLLSWSTVCKYQNAKCPNSSYFLF